MPLYAVSLLFSLEVQAPDAPEPLRELALHVVSAVDQDEAQAKADDIGRARQTSYKNRNGELVRDIFKGIAEVQSLMGDRLFDGMEVASWIFEPRERLVLDERGIAPGVPGVRTQP